jgi:hypothetical protein
VPADRLAEVAGFAGVTLVEKDRLVTLSPAPATGKNYSHPMAYEVQDLAGVQVEAVDPLSFSPASLPEGYANFLYTGAYSTWPDTGAGAGTVVAVVDTGTVPNVCLAHAVIGHIFPMWSGWRGGYGMSPMIGGFLVLDPAGLAVTTAGLSSVILASHDRRLMMLWPVTVPLWGAARGRRDILAFGVVANVVYWARLVPELRRGLRSILSVARPVNSGGFNVATAEGSGSTGGQQDPEGDESDG